jgi:hypothetical protein
VFVITMVIEARRVLGLTVSPGLLAIVDEVIE